MNLEHYVAESLQKAQTVADAIAGALRQAILEGALQDGQPLRQAELAAKFGVSRIPIREALLKLEREGLVEARPRRGTVVTALSADDFEEILEMRVALESLALHVAIPRMRDEDIRVASSVLEQADEALRSDGSSDARRKEFETRWGDLNWAFHRALYAPAGKPRLLDSIENLHLLFARHLRPRLEIIAPAPSADPREIARHRAEWASALQEHRDILEACKKGDARLARVILEKHIGHHGKELVRRLRAAR